MSASPRPAPNNPQTFNPGRGDHRTYGYAPVRLTSTVPLPANPLSKPIELVVRESAKPTSGPRPNL